MALIDKFNTFHTATVVTDAARYAGDTIDQLQPGDAVGGSEVDVIITVNTAFAGGTNVTFSLETHTADSFGSARTVLWSSGVILTAALPVRTQIKFKIPSGALRYLAVIATSVGTHSGGSAFSAAIADEAPRNS